MSGARTRALHHPAMSLLLNFAHCKPSAVSCRGGRRTRCPNGHTLIALPQQQLLQQPLRHVPSDILSAPRCLDVSCTAQAGSSGAPAGQVTKDLMDSMAANITTALDATAVRVSDVYGDAQHVEIHVVSPAFEGKSAMNRQRMVYKVCMHATLGIGLQGSIYIVSRVQVSLKRTSFTACWHYVVKCRVEASVAMPSCNHLQLAPSSTNKGSGLSAQGSGLTHWTYPPYGRGQPDGHAQGSHACSTCVGGAMNMAHA